MALSAGTKIGPYKIIAPIGAVGMGEMYKARDPRLRRNVAIKVSAQQGKRMPPRQVRTNFQRIQAARPRHRIW